MVAPSAAIGAAIGDATVGAAVASPCGVAGVVVFTSAVFVASGFAAAVPLFFAGAFFAAVRSVPVASGVRFAVPPDRVACAFSPVPELRGVCGPAFTFLPAAGASAGAFPPVGLAAEPLVRAAFAGAGGAALAGVPLAAATSLLAAPRFAVGLVAAADLFADRAFPVGFFAATGLPFAGAALRPAVAFTVDFAVTFFAVVDRSAVAASGDTFGLAPVWSTRLALLATFPAVLARPADPARVLDAALPFAAFPPSAPLAAAFVVNAA
jgi:hypothetical protein